MNRIEFPLFGVALLATPLLLATNGAHAQVIDEAADQKDREETISSVNTMRRALVISLNRALAEHYKAAEEKAEDAGVDISRVEVATPFGYTYRSGVGPFIVATQGGASESRGHYVPGHGAFFSLEVVIPRQVVEPEESESDPDEEEDDVWKEAAGIPTGARLSDDTAAVLYGAAVGLTGGKAVEMVLDEVGVEVALSTVVKAIGDYGLRVSGVGGNESIIVVLEIRGGSAIAVDGSAAADDQVLMFNTISTAPNSSDGRKVVIEVAMKDIKRYADDEDSVDALMSRAKITSYVVPKRSGWGRFGSR